MDSVVYCGETTAEDPLGSARLVAADGAPSLSGKGMLELFAAGGWSPVCGVTPGAAQVACKAMGYAGASASATEAAPWNMKTPSVGALSCSGTEESLVDCSFEEGDDVFCAPVEAAVLQCTGGGEAAKL